MLITTTRIFFTPPIATAQPSVLLLYLALTAVTLVLTPRQIFIHSPLLFRHFFFFYLFLIMMIATMATSTSSLPILSLHTQPIRKLNRHSYLAIYFTKKRLPSNCKSSARQSFFPTEASSSLYSSSSVAKKTEPMVPPYNVLITGSTKGQYFPLFSPFLSFWFKKYEALQFTCSVVCFFLGFLFLSAQKKLWFYFSG